MQGPSSLCSWKSSTTRGPVGGGRGHLKGAALVGQQQPGRVDPEQFDALDGQLMEQVDDVVVGDQSVGQGDECLGQRPTEHHRHSELRTLPSVRRDRVVLVVRCYSRSRQPVERVCNSREPTSDRSRCCVVISRSG
jgi:hypothetical protein